jgi:N-methylhydantoinase A
VATRLGVDVGGTFTDLIFYDERSGEVRVSKELSTPSAPEQGIGNAVDAAVSRDALAATEFFVHGTTVGLNSLLERRGAVVGLLTTRGFRDVLEIRRADRDNLYDIFSRNPAPLVPRSRVHPVTERLMADGTVETELVREDVARALEALREDGVESIAVAFLNAYANPAHELLAEELLHELGFEGAISLSHRISREYREYERTSTTVVDAYVRPRMQSYLRRLEDRLGEGGFDGRYLITRSGGGAMTFGEAASRPFETVMSGPVAGANGAGEIARRLGIEQVITADVGGTSFDTCLVSAGRPQLMYQGSIVGLPVLTPWVDVRSIGAGGSSIAHVDVGGLLKVGPRSAGSDPGPASYGRGGTEPTVTDAAFLLGMLGPGELAGSVTLDRERATAAMEPLAEALGFDVDTTAKGILTVAAASMANAIREITIEQGQDPRACALMPFGGAGSLFGLLLARELEIGLSIVPPHAGNFSAWGLLGADLTREVARTRLMKLRPEAITELNSLAASMFEELDGLGDPGDDGERRAREVKLDARYAGQEHSLTIEVPSDELGSLTEDAEAIGRRFADTYAGAFGQVMEEEVEIVAVRAASRVLLPERAAEPPRAEAAADAEAPTADAYSFAREEWMPFRIVERERFPVGSTIAGPAVVREPTATTYLDAGFVAEVDASGCLKISQEETR